MNDVTAAWQTRVGKRGEGYTGGSYYGLPAVKASPFKWETSAYLFVGGLAGAAQLLATVADVAGGRALRPVVRNGRYLALGGTAVGAALLIADLKTPRRWYNMLRIFRRTSPMSIGSYVLTAFGATSGLTALGTALPLGPLARIAQWPAALAGAAMTTYTGALLSATSNPLWASEYRTLSARLGVGAMASGAAALSLLEACAGRQANAAKLERYALVASISQGALTAVAHRRHEARGVGGPLAKPGGRVLQVAGNVLALAIPAACYAAARLQRRPSPALPALAAVSLLAGTAVKRWHHLKAGNESAQRPEDYLRYAQAELPRAPSSVPAASAAGEGVPL